MVLFIFLKINAEDKTIFASSKNSMTMNRLKGMSGAGFNSRFKEVFILGIMIIVGIVISNMLGG
jgi:hypothetical protein